ncbi:endonuclease/exonuclease/phosphatase family protein [Leucobacter sp. 1207-22]|uniref:endonuclease/exonuclease/phosphatase family protein n=1 Tax=Leucobacter sp. 1207-22 TaxID=2604456 RepID=UPI004064A862
MKTISYNLRKNRAACELHELVDAHDADVLCLQEADAMALPERLGKLKLVHATEKNRLGLAMYVDSERFHVRESRTFQLKKSMHDRVLAPAHERLLGVHMHDYERDSDVVAASFHAAPLTALNSLRRSQIHAALAQLRTFGHGLPVLMVGDYNYPVFKKRLDAEMRDTGYNLNLSDKRTYTRYGMFRGHFDFATSQGFDVASVQTLGRGISDHLPIMVTSLINEPVVYTAAPERKLELI